MVKKMFTTFLIIVGIVVGAIAVCVGIMVCFPQISLFGFNYVKDNVVDNLSVLKIDDQTVKISDLDGIYVDLDKYELTISRQENISSDSQDEIFVETNSSFVGLLRKNNDGVLVKSFQLKPSIEVQENGDKILVIRANEPTGIIIPSKLAINLKLCVEKDANISNLKTVSLNVKNANTTIAENDFSLTCENLTLSKESTTKSIETGNLTATKKMELNITSGRVDFSKAAKSTTDVTINTRAGNFEFANVKNITVNSETNPYIKINENVYGYIEYYCKSGSLYAKNVMQNIAINTDSAAIEFGSIYGTISTTSYSNPGKEDCNSNIKIASIENITGLNADSEDNSAIIRTTNGNVIIGSTSRRTTITTQKGAITIGNEITSGVNCKELNIETRRGQIKAYFNKNQKVLVNIVSTQSGKIELFDLNPEESSVIESRDNTEIYVKLADLTVQDFKIKSCGKQVRVDVPINCKIDLDLEGSLVDINLSSIGEEINIDKKGYNDGIVIGKEDKVGCTYTNENSKGKLTITNERQNSKCYVFDAD